MRGDLLGVAADVGRRHDVLEREQGMLVAGRLRSRPRVKGTTQNAHMLSQPRMIDTNAETPFVP